MSSPTALPYPLPSRCRHRARCSPVHCTPKGRVHRRPPHHDSLPTSSTSSPLSSHPRHCAHCVCAHTNPNPRPPPAAVFFHHLVWASAPHQDALLQGHRQALLLDGEDDQVGGAGRRRGRGGDWRARVQLPSPAEPGPARVAQHRLHRGSATPLGGLCGRRERGVVSKPESRPLLSENRFSAGPRRPLRCRPPAPTRHQP
jgi:hypothetical protein